MKSKQILKFAGVFSLFTIIVLLIVGIFAPTLPPYDKLCRELSNEKYNVVTVSQYFSQDSDPSKITVILVHECNSDIPFHLYEVEKSYGVKSTFYVRPYAENDYYYSDNIVRLKNMESEGWEIGFLYDSVSKTNWDVYPGITRIILENGTVIETPTPLKEDMDYEVALKKFMKELNIMKAVFDVKTVKAYLDKDRKDIDNSWLFYYYVNMTEELKLNQFESINWNSHSAVNESSLFIVFDALDKAESGDVIVVRIIN